MPEGGAPFEIHSMLERPDLMLAGIPRKDLKIVGSFLSAVRSAARTVEEESRTDNGNQAEVKSGIPITFLTDKKARSLFVKTVGTLLVAGAKAYGWEDDYKKFAQNHDLGNSPRLIKGVHDKIMGIFNLPLAERYENFMEMVNGKGARALGNKYTMNEVFRELDLGFNLPRQSLVEPAQPIDEAMALTNGIGSETGYIFKPRDGVLGTDVFVVKPEENEANENYQGRIRDTLVKCLKTNSHYVVQEFVPYEEKGADVRLIMYGDNDGKVFTAFQRMLRPEVVGDGKSTLKELIERIPSRYRAPIRVMKEMKDKIKVERIEKRLTERNIDLEQVLSEGEVMKLAQIGNITHGADEIVQTGIEEANLNKCVAHLVTGLRARGVLPNGAFALCFDTGVNLEVFGREDAKPEELYQAMTIIESQLPFGPPTILVAEPKKFIKVLNGMFYAVATRDEVPEITGGQAPLSSELNLAERALAKLTNEVGHLVAKIVTDDKKHPWESYLERTQSRAERTVSRTIMAETDWPDATLGQEKEDDKLASALIEAVFNENVTPPEDEMGYKSLYIKGKRFLVSNSRMGFYTSESVSKSLEEKPDMPLIFISKKRSEKEILEEFGRLPENVWLSAGWIVKDGRAQVFMAGDHLAVDGEVNMQIAENLASELKLRQMESHSYTELIDGREKLIVARAINPDLRTNHRTILFNTCQYFLNRENVASVPFTFPIRVEINGIHRLIPARVEISRSDTRADFDRKMREASHNTQDLGRSKNATRNQIYDWFILSSQGPRISQTVFRKLRKLSIGKRVDRSLQGKFLFSVMMVDPVEEDNDVLPIASTTMLKLDEDRAVITCVRRKIQGDKRHPVISISASGDTQFWKEESLNALMDEITSGIEVSAGDD